jgi:hypothetical protein
MHRYVSAAPGKIIATSVIASLTPQPTPHAESMRTPAHTRTLPAPSSRRATRQRYPTWLSEMVARERPREPPALAAGHLGRMRRSEFMLLGAIMTGAVLPL